MAGAGGATYLRPVKDPCAPCGLCCRSYLVPIFGHDLWRIATRRGLPPESFAFIAEQETPDPLGFRLEADGPTHGLALLKVEPMAPTQPCIFLEETGPSQSRCGIYDDRPITCRSYPMAKFGDGVYQRSATLCPPGSWDEADVAAAHWRETLQCLRRHRDIYVEVVARWNAAISRWRPPGMLPPKMFCDYVLAVFGQVAAAEDSIGPERLADLTTQWAQVQPRGGEGPEVTVDRSREPAWIAHFREIRRLIDGFFPELEPLPFQSLVVEAVNRDPDR